MAAKWINKGYDKLEPKAETHRENVKDSNKIFAVKVLKYLNIILAVVHLCTTIGAFVWTVASPTLQKNVHLTLDPLVKNTTNNNFTTTIIDLQDTYTPMIPILIATLVAGLFNFAKIFSFFYYRYLTSIKRGVYYFRWVEYMVSGSALVWAVAVLVGITNVMLLLSLVVCFAASVALFWAHDNFSQTAQNILWVETRQVVAKELKEIAGKDQNGEQLKTVEIKSFTDSLKPRDLMEWRLFVPAAILNVWIWAVIWTYVGFALRSGVSDFPWYRYVVPIIVSICFAVSGISEIVVHYGFNKRFKQYTEKTFKEIKETRKSDEVYVEGVTWLVIHEIIMLICSAVAKQTTLWLVVGAFTNPTL
jgi:hypothetical protein